MCAVSGILFSARNELPSDEKTWRKVKCMLLSERSRTEETTHCGFLVYDVLEKDKTMETKKIIGYWQLGVGREV